MIDALVCLVVCASLAVVLTMGLGIIYFLIALGIVNFFGLNYGEKPLGFKVLNCSLILTILSYFVVFAILLRMY
jgi:hypothetical protein